MAAKNIPVDCQQSLAWDPALILTTALKHVGTNATPEKLRSYLAGMRGVAGVNGTYDFKRVPQRGIDNENVVIVRWNQSNTSWTPPAKQAAPHSSLDKQCESASPVTPSVVEGPPPASTPPMSAKARSVTSRQKPVAAPRLRSG